MKSSLLVVDVFLLADLQAYHVCVCGAMDSFGVDKSLIQLHLLVVS